MEGRPGTYREPTSYSLTPRQIEILQLSANGMGYREIARNLGISFHTVKNTMSNKDGTPSAFGRMGVHGITEAVAVALRRGIIE